MICVKETPELQTLSINVYSKKVPIGFQNLDKRHHACIHVCIFWYVCMNIRVYVHECSYACTYTRCTGSIKSKPNCLCHIYLISDHIILKLY